MNAAEQTQNRCEGPTHTGNDACSEDVLPQLPRRLLGHEERPFRFRGPWLKIRICLQNKPQPATHSQGFPRFLVICYCMLFMFTLMFLINKLY